ncbi:unnamed protein product [Closterium sp. NIES-53]
MEAAGVADMAAITRATYAVAADSTASATIVTRAHICGAIASSSLMDGPLLKAKSVEEQEGEEKAVEAVAVAEPSPVKHVTSALGQRAEVKGMGKAMFKGADGKMVGLKNVLWVPNLAANLISVRRLQKVGMDTSSKGAKTYTTRLGERILWDLHEDRDVYNKMWQIPVVPMPMERQVAARISTKGEAVGSGDGANGRAKEIKSKKCNLGVTSKLGKHEESGVAAKMQHKDEEKPKAAAEEEYGENMWGNIASAAFSNPTSATGECDWLTLHRRMGHVALPILQQLVKNEMVAGIRVKGEPDEVLGCPACMQAKFTRYPFSSSEATAKAPLDEVVMDVVGPLKLGGAGAEYFLTIVDVYTRMTWVYVLSKKSDVAETVKTDWLPMVERQQDRLVKAIRTDRGGEFLRKEFGLWLKKNGIRHSLTMPYSLAMNGIAERANRTITETVRGLLIEAGLPDYFWPDAVRSACVAKNRALNHVGADKWVPYVEWIGRKPKVDMLRVFGCICMALVPKHLRHNKLGAKVIWAVHLGMAQNSKGWLLWDPFTKKFLVSRDCKFMENLMYKDWKAENEAKIGMRFGEVKSSGLEHVELPLELSSSTTTTRQSSLVNGGEEAKDAEEEEEEVQQVSERAPTLPSRTTSAPRIRVTPQQRQGLHVPAAEEEGRGKRRIQAPNRLTYEALGKPAKSALAGVALIVGDDEESDYDECAFAFFSLVEMPGEPATLKEALESSDAEEWKKAMESELKSIEENGTWELVELPEGRNAITSKWLFKIKSDADGKIERYNSRLVAKGYQQKEVDYKELFSPLVKPTMLRTLLAGSAIKGWVVKQMDVTTAYLNGILEEEIFMAQPEGFDDGSGRVWKLKKALYGLKQAPRQWYLKLRKVLEEIGFTPSSADHSLFMLGEGEQRSFMVVYVDDILIFSPSSDLVKEVMLKLQDNFKCMALGDVSFYLGLHIERDVEKRCMRVHQRKYLEALAAKFGQSEGHVATPFPSGFNVFLGFPPDAPGWQFYHPTSRCLFHSQVVTFDESVPFYRLFPYHTAPPLPPPLFLAPGPPPVDPLPPQGPAPLGVSQVDPLPGTVPVEVAVASSAARGAASGGAASGGAASEGAQSEGPGSGGAGPGGAEIGGAEPAGVEPGGTAAAGPGGARTRGTGAAGTGSVGGARAGGAGVGDPAEPGGARAGGAGAGGTSAGGAEAGGVGASNTGAVDPGAGGAVAGGAVSDGTGTRGTLQPGSPLPAPSPYAEQTDSFTERCEPKSRPASPIRAVCTGPRVPCPRPPLVPSTHAMALSPSSVPLRVPLPALPESSLPAVLDPESDLARAASPTVSRLLATIVTDPSFESAAASALVAELVDFAAASRLDYATALIAETESASPPSIGGECALGTDVFEDRQEDFECLAAAVPRFASMLLAPEGDPDAPDIPTPRSYAEAITGPYSS